MTVFDRALFSANDDLQWAAAYRDAHAPMTWPARIANYATVTGYPPAFWAGENDVVYAFWILGNNYRVASHYFGGYPHGYLTRIRALFPDKVHVLHVFSGQVDLVAFPGDTVDINPTVHPTFVDDAQTLTQVPLELYDLVLCDPPYSVEDADHYVTTMVKRNVVLSTLGRRLTPGCHVIWLDQVLPMYRKTAFVVEAYIGLVKSTNHRFRVITIFKKR